MTLFGGKSILAASFISGVYTDITELYTAERGREEYLRSVVFHHVTFDAEGVKKRDSTSQEIHSTPLRLRDKHPPASTITSLFIHVDRHTHVWRQSRNNEKAVDIVHTL